MYNSTFLFFKFEVHFSSVLNYLLVKNKHASIQINLLAKKTFYGNLTYQFYFNQIPIDYVRRIFSMYNF